MQEEVTPKHTVALADAEKDEAAKKAERRSRLIASLEKFLCDNRVTVGEMNAILRTFNERNERVINRLTVNEIVELSNK